MTEKKKYRKVRVDYFRHEKTRGLGAIAKLLMIYLTTPHASGICCKSIAQLRGALDAGLSLEVVRSALNELVDAGVVKWDEENEVAWVVEGMDEQVDMKKHPMMAKGVMAHLDTLPASPLIVEFLERYGDWLRRSGIQLDEAQQLPLRAVAQPSEPADPETVEGGGDHRADRGSDGRVDGRSDVRAHPGVDLLFDPGRNQVAGSREHEQVTESRESEGRGRPTRAKERPLSQASPNSNPGSNGKAEYLAAERQIATAFEEALGVPAAHGIYRYAIERWQKGDATVEEILTVIGWWSANKTLADCHLRQCFQRGGDGAQWGRMEALALDRAAAPAPTGPRRSTGPAMRVGQDEARAAYNRQMRPEFEN